LGAGRQITNAWLLVSEALLQWLLLSVSEAFSRQGQAADCGTLVVWAMCWLLRDLSSDWIADWQPCPVRLGHTISNTYIDIAHK